MLSKSQYCWISEIGHLLTWVIILSVFWFLLSLPTYLLLVIVKNGFWSRRKSNVIPLGFILVNFEQNLFQIPWYIQKAGLNCPMEQLQSPGIPKHMCPRKSVVILCPEQPWYSICGSISGTTVTFLSWGLFHFFFFFLIEAAQKNMIILYDYLHI